MSKADGNIKRTSYDWWKSDKYSSVVIFDADGWDRSSFEAWKRDFYDTPVTEEEFLHKLNYSTVVFVPYAIETDKKTKKEGSR